MRIIQCDSCEKEYDLSGEEFFAVVELPGMWYGSEDQLSREVMDICSPECMVAAIREALFSRGWTDPFAAAPGQVMEGTPENGEDELTEEEKEELRQVALAKADQDVIPDAPVRRLRRKDVSNGWQQPNIPASLVDTIDGLPT